MKEVEHILDILKRARQASDKEDVGELKKLSDMTVHGVSIYQDEDGILAAIVIYALAKLIERKTRYSDKDYGKYLNFYKHSLDDSIQCIEGDKCDEFRNHVASMIKRTDKLPDEFRNDVSYIFRKARINKASKVYEHGVSMEKTAKLLGISQWELAEYIGPTNLSDNSQSKTISAKKRVQEAMNFFK